MADNAVWYISTKDGTLGRFDTNVKTIGSQVPSIFAYIGLILIIAIPAAVLSVAAYKKTPHFKTIGSDIHWRCNRRWLFLLCLWFITSKGSYPI